MREHENQQVSLLIVEDSATELRRYVNYARKLRWGVSGVQSSKEARAILQRRDFLMVLIDLFLENEDDSSGLELLQYIRKHFPRTLTLVMSHAGEPAIFRRAIKAGAHHLIKKPVVDVTELELAYLVARDKAKLLLGAQAAGDEEKSRGKQDLGPRLVFSETTRKLSSVVAANPDLPSVIYGETGTGKEEVARFIWRSRMQREGVIPFVPVNCSLLNSELASSLLFGHVRGAFSGAEQNTVGYVGQANGGILFLDEIHTLSLVCQEKLLRVLNDGRYKKSGKFVSIARFSRRLSLQPCSLMMP